MAEDIYRKLQQQLDRYSIGFPATESGIELKILKNLFSDENAPRYAAIPFVHGLFEFQVNEEMGCFALSYLLPFIPLNRPSIAPVFQHSTVNGR